MGELRDIVERACQAVCDDCAGVSWKNVFGQTVQPSAAFTADGRWWHSYSFNGKPSKGKGRCWANNIRNAFYDELPEVWDSTRFQQERCKCFHTYERHFDSHENMEPVGCKYCQCQRFEAIT